MDEIAKARTDSLADSGSNFLSSTRKTEFAAIRVPNNTLREGQAAAMPLPWLERLLLRLRRSSLIDASTSKRSGRSLSKHSGRLLRTEPLIARAMLRSRTRRELRLHEARRLRLTLARCTRHPSRRRARRRGATWRRTTSAHRNGEWRAQGSRGAYSTADKAATAKSAAAVQAMI
eukprot:6182051-Pleurochrysis_carterae.AAC.3